ncbi:MAG: hypothetical protein ACYC8V_09550 [Caulobacteraceae bacterium]
METPNPSVSGMIAWALVEALVEVLEAKGLLSAEDRALVIETALQKFPANDHRVFVAPSRAFLQLALKVQPPRK